VRPDRLRDRAKGGRAAPVADGQVRHDVVVPAVVGGAGRERSEGQGGERTERRLVARAEPHDVFGEPADPVQRERERGESCEQGGERGQHRVVDQRRRQERVEHGQVGGDAVAGARVEPGAVLPHRRLRGGDEQQERALETGGAVLDAHDIRSRAGRDGRAGHGIRSRVGHRGQRYASVRTMALGFQAAQRHR
jgi:hypothetical protein